MNEKIILYPSNWLYNAGVVGFLRVLEFGAGREFFSFEENKVEIKKESIPKGWEWTLKYHKVLNKEFVIWGKNKRYPNYIQSKQKDFFEKVFVPTLRNVVNNHPHKVCSWCEGYFLPEDTFKKLEKEWIEKVKEKRSKSSKEKRSKSSKSFSDFVEQREKFQAIHMGELGGAITKMPNSFWNLNFSMPLCHLCSYLIIFHHLAFVESNKESKKKSKKNFEIFINTPHFQLTWDLNKFASEILEKEKEYELRKLLGVSLLQWAIKRRVLLGVWTMMNIEVIIKRDGIIDYFDLPYHITRILLDYEIADLINRIGEEKIFDLIVSGKFDELEKANYFVLKAFLKLKNNEKLSENDPVTKYIDNYRDSKHLSKISNLLPELYAKIIKILKTEVKYG